MEKFGKSAELVPDIMQNYQSSEKFEIVYASGPSNWMYNHPMIGLPKEFLSFIDEKLNDGGLFLARIYDGLHKPPLIHSRHYLNTVISSLKNKYLLKAAYYCPKRHQTFLVIQKNGKPILDTETFLTALETVEGKKLYQTTSTSLKLNLA